MDIETKKQMIYESFDILKDSWSSKDEALTRLIHSMYEIEPQTALEMWTYLLKKNEELLADYWKGGYGLVNSIIQSIVFGLNEGTYRYTFNDENEIKLANLIFKNRELYSILFGSFPHMEDRCATILSHLIVSNDLDRLNEVLELMLKNNYSGNNSMGKVLIYAIEHIEDCAIPKQNIQLIEDFILQIDDKVDRAETFTALLSIK